MTSERSTSTAPMMESGNTVISKSRPERSPARSLKILEVTPRYLPFMGGVENHVYQISQRLAKAGMDVTVLTTGREGGLSSREVLEGVKIQRVDAWPANCDYYFAPGIWRAITNGHWDIVHIQSYHTLVPPMAMWAALHARIPYIVTFHGGGNASRLRNALRVSQRALLRPLLARAERFVAVAEFEIELYGTELRIPATRFSLIPNGADLPDLGTSQQSAAIDRTIIASVGRLEPYKGHQRMIRALPYLMQRVPDVHLWIAGGGPYEQGLRGLARELGVEARVEIRAVPPTNRETMARELSKAALVVLLSEYETQPIAVLEAIALGKPVLVADTSGLSEIAAKGWARAVSLKSTPSQIAAAAAEEILHPREPILVRLPTWDDCAASLLDLYLTIVREARCES